MKRAITYKSEIGTVLCNTKLSGKILTEESYDIGEVILEVFELPHQICIKAQSNGTWLIGECLVKMMQICVRMGEIVKSCNNSQDKIVKMKYDLAFNIIKYITDNFYIVLDHG